MIEVNYIAVLLASVASMVVGFVYYSPFVLGKPWMKLMGYSQEDMKPKGKQMPKMYLTSYILSLVTAYVLYHVMSLSLNFFNYSAVVTGLTSGFWMWLGFVMPVQATDYLFGKKKLELVCINTGYQLVSLLVMGVVIGLVR